MCVGVCVFVRVYDTIMAEIARLTRLCEALTSASTRAEQQKAAERDSLDASGDAGKRLNILTMLVARRGN